MDLYLFICPAPNQATNFSIYKTKKKKPKGDLLAFTCPKKQKQIKPTESCILRRVFLVDDCAGGVKI